MKNANVMMDSQSREAVELAVAEAEKRTSAEIVCAVATESGRYDRAEAVGGLAFGLLGLAAAHVTFTTLAVRSDSWDVVPMAPLWLNCLAVAAGFVVGNLLFGRFHGPRAFFVSGGEMECETLRAAHHVFASQGLRRTAGRGGLLVYVSLFERRLILLADDGVMEKLGQEFLDELRDRATVDLKAGRFLEGLTGTVRGAADRLADALPIQANDVNELANRVIVFHPRP